MVVEGLLQKLLMITGFVFWHQPSIKLFIPTGCPRKMVHRKTKLYENSNYSSRQVSPIYFQSSKTTYKRRKISGEAFLVTQL